MTYRFGHEFEIAFGFDSAGAGAATLYVGGYYDFFNGNDDFSLGTNFGTANSPYGAHFFVVLGAQTVDDLTLRVTGTSWVDATGTRTAGDTEDIVIPSGTLVDSYFETSKKWIGQVSITVQAGTAKTCNYGWCKYWDSMDHCCWLKGFEVTGVGGAADAGADFLIRHHKTTGWTYNAGSTPTPPAAIAQFSSDYSTESDVKNNEQFAWKQSHLSQKIEGNKSEGLIFEAIQTQARPFVDGNVVYRIGTTP